MFYNTLPDVNLLFFGVTCSLLKGISSDKTIGSVDEVFARLFSISFVNLEVPTLFSSTATRPYMFKAVSLSSERG